MDKKILQIEPLGFPWKTLDPFLFCAYHKDDFPKGNENMEPDSSLLLGRNIGEDFTIKDGWRMYHGDKVPGFPSHPHRGFETITVVEKGVVDHADSLGGAGRYGKGDIQWMTAGRGIQHSEMFPLLNMDKDNPLEMFQIWLNLPKASKLVEPHFAMIWDSSVPTLREEDSNGKLTEIRVVSGEIKGVKSLSPAPNSWASNPQNEVLVCTIKMEAGAKFVIPKTNSFVNRALYFYKGSSINIDDTKINSSNFISVKSDMEIDIQCGDSDGQILILQGKPINEPVAQYGPFVMNAKTEIQSTFDEYEKNHFGGWQWARSDLVHDRKKSCFALHSDGRLEKKQ